MNTKEVTEYLNNLSYLISIRRRYFSPSSDLDLIRHIVRLFGYDLRITPKLKLIRLVRR